MFSFVEFMQKLREKYIKKLFYIFIRENIFLAKFSPFSILLIKKLFASCKAAISAGMFAINFNEIFS
jgi:hypothetical protein